MNERANLPALIVGGAVGAIIPQSIEETWRLATMIVEGGLAPQALVGREPAEGADDAAWNRWGKKGTSAVAIVIMSGAELGLPPMVALRSFTVIGGKPAVYGDGLINVCRRSPRCKSLKTGYLHDATPEALIRLGVDKDKVATMKTADERSVGWCDATRSDTGERSVEVFSIANAKKAGLWDERPTRRGKVWKNGKQEWGDVPNDATWFRYPERMLRWRAAGYCLRELFADVLGGIRDEFEAREIAGVDLIEHSEVEAKPARISPPSPPSPPSPGSNEDADPSEIVTETGESTDAIMDGEPTDDEPMDYGKFFEDFQIALAGAKTQDDVEEVWSEFDVESRFEGDDESRQLADRIKSRRLLALHPARAG